jgi:hypothetical protein
MAKILQLRIELDNTEPKIWRSVQINDDLIIDALHPVIQIAMGWEFDHMYAFSPGTVKKKKKNNDDYLAKLLSDILSGKALANNKLNSKKLDPFEEDEEEAFGALPITEVFLKKGSKIKYEYDFGDSWRHTITLEKIIEADKPLKKPLCIAGEMACPPEDIGGVWGYYEALEIVNDKKNPGYEDFSWLKGFKPDKFDLKKVNKKFGN